MAYGGPTTTGKRVMANARTPAPEPARPGHDWMTLLEAYQLLGYSTLAGLDPFRCLKHVKCTSALPVVGRKPWLLKRADVERIALLMREADLQLPAAARVVAAENEGRI